MLFSLIDKHWKKIPAALIRSDKKFHGIGRLFRNIESAANIFRFKRSVRTDRAPTYSLYDHLDYLHSRIRKRAETINTYTHRYTAREEIYDSPPTRNGGWKARSPICRGTDRISRHEGCLCVHVRTDLRTPNRRPRLPGPVTPTRDSSDPWAPALSRPLHRQTSEYIYRIFTKKAAVHE